MNFWCIQWNNFSARTSVGISLPLKFEIEIVFENWSVIVKFLFPLNVRVVETVTTHKAQAEKYFGAEWNFSKKWFRVQRGGDEGINLTYNED